MFTQRALDFLYFNHKNNSKQWYSEHKEDYKKYLVEPFAELVDKLAPTMLSIDDKFIVEPKVDKTISRIYKDMRYSQDGYLYRDKMWLLFIRDKKLYNGLPGYFFELSPYGVRYGCGYYQADGNSIKNFRQLILDNSPVFQKAFDCVKNQNYFELYGDSIKGVKYQDYPEDVRDWLCRKNMGLISDKMDIDTLLSEDLDKFLAERFIAVKPYYDMMLAAELMK